MVQNFWRSSQVRTTFQDANWLPNGVKFSTHDQENDDTIVQCNTLGDNGKSSGWWYKSSAQKFFENKIGQADVIGNFEARFKEALARMKNLSEGRKQRDEYRYDSLRQGVS